MEVMLSNGVSYAIEFIKVILVATYILNIQVKKGINEIFGISLISVILLSQWFDLSEYSILYGLIAIVIFLVTLFDKKRILFVILAYIGISLVDMLFAVICIPVFRLTIKQIQDNFLIAIALNTISLIFLIIFLVFFKNKQFPKGIYRIEKYTPIFILGGLSISVYLTCTQFIGLEYQYTAHKKELVISAVIITTVYFAICYLLIEKQAVNYCLKIENDMNARLLKSQNDYYAMMLKKEEETKMFRHDIQQHILCVQMLYDQKKYDELGEYLTQLSISTKELSPKISSGNSYIDMILADMQEQFPEVMLEWTGKMPKLLVSSMDLCTLFYNLLKNAFESAHTAVEKSIKVRIKVQGRNVMLQIANNYENIKFDRIYGYLSTKEEKGHGYGIKNIRKCVEKYNGSYVTATENRVFCTEIILPNVIEQE